MKRKKKNKYTNILNTAKNNDINVLKYCVACEVFSSLILSSLSDDEKEEICELMYNFAYKYDDYLNVDDESSEPPEIMIKVVEDIFKSGHNFRLLKTIFYDKMLYGEYLSYLNECGYFGEDRHNDDKGFEDYMKSNGESSSSEYEKFKNLYYTKFANDSDDSILNVNDKDNEDKYDELNF